ncbi:MAG: STAS domain-containing protein [Nitrospinae bacterium]|nr:STAS domain-containing protein [Nitrospinota bacterium]
MEIDVKNEKGVIVVSLKGNINVNSSPQLMKQLQDLIKSGESKILLDMAGVTFLSSSAIGTIAGTFNDLKEKNGQLKMTALSKEIKHIFEITGLDKRIPISSTLEEGLASFTE